MRRERALKVVLVVVGVIFCALAYPLIMFVKQFLFSSVICHPRPNVLQCALAPPLENVPVPPLFLP